GDKDRRIVDSVACACDHVADMKRELGFLGGNERGGQEERDNYGNETHIDASDFSCPGLSYCEYVSVNSFVDSLPPLAMDDRRFPSQRLHSRVNPSLLPHPSSAVLERPRSTPRAR